MKPSSRHIKLGLFALLGIAALVTALLYLGFQRSASITYHTYFDESVQGLDEGAIVKFRGVRIGKVARIGVAPDRRLIDVAMAMDRQRAEGLNLDELAPQLRTQLVIFGITGVKLIDIDFADQNTPPPPKLAFTPAEHFIPSQPSLLTSIQDDAVAFVHKLPGLVDRSVVALDSLNTLTGDARDVLEYTRRTMIAITSLSEHAEKANVTRTLKSTLRTFDDLGRRAAGITDALERSVRQVGDAARSLQDFLETLEREPDILIKGRSRQGRR